MAPGVPRIYLATVVLGAYLSTCDRCNVLFVFITVYLVDFLIDLRLQIY